MKQQPQILKTEIHVFLFLQESYTDVTLSCEGNFYPLHKLVLSTCSEYFEKIFERTPCKHPVIVLNDIKCRELEALLSYMYAGEVSVPQSNLAMLIKVAEVLQIKGLAVPDTPPAPVKSKSSSLESGAERGSPHPPKRRRTEERLVDTTRTMHESTSPNVRLNPTEKGRQVTHEEGHPRKGQEEAQDPLSVSEIGVCINKGKFVICISTVVVNNKISNIIIICFSHTAGRFLCCRN